MYLILNIIYCCVICICVCFNWNDLGVAVLYCVVPVKLIRFDFYVVLNEFLGGGVVFGVWYLYVLKLTWYRLG